MYTYASLFPSLHSQIFLYSVKKYSVRRSGDWERGYTYAASGMEGTPIASKVGGVCIVAVAALQFGAVHEDPEVPIINYSITV